MPAARARKKQKRLDAIVDRSAASPDAAGEDGDLLRRSSRVRRPPVVLDSSPVPTVRNRNSNSVETLTRSIDDLSSKRRRPVLEIKNGDGSREAKPIPIPLRQHKESPSNPSKDSDTESGDWRSRLRSRAAKGRGGASFGHKGNDSAKPKPKRVMSLATNSRRKKRPLISGDRSLDSKKSEEQAAILSPLEDEEKNSKEASSGGEGIKPDSDKKSDGESDKALEDSGQMREIEEINSKEASEEEETELDSDKKYDAEPDKELENAAQTGETEEVAKDTEVGERNETDPIADRDNQNNTEVVDKEEPLKEKNAKTSVSDDLHSLSRLKEGRRCGLCGRGVDGRPPKKLVQDSNDSDKEACEGSSTSEEPNYDIWDGFGDEPEWLGRLLGPIHDRFGIARVWVHQHCAVWSPEVYFAGLGCLKNVRAALCRGRTLKCSRCGRPGATIGCRVDRCFKTYHLPCSRTNGCIFDHRKFLIACNEHRHLFQPRGDDYSHQIRKMKAKKLKSDIKRRSNDAMRKDFEAEEKWLENCGEDEEFLRREGKRLHRDILRIAPVYIGGSLESENLYKGWDSVAGLQEVIHCLKEVVVLPLLYPEFFSTMGITPPRGILLHGYPGTGKTLVVRALIGACSRGGKRIAYFARKGADCLGKYVGDAERQLRLLFQVAEKSQPSIIFFDEIDGLAPCRSRHQDQTHCSVVSTLLSLLDGLKSRGSVIVIGATNRPEAVDPALRRPGRFDREIYFPLPSEKDRSAILSLHTQSWPNPISGSLLSWISKQTAGYAGADLQSLCTQSAMNSLKRNYALHELLCSAEKGSNHDRIPSVLSLFVEERDWLEAIAFASPPCSRRDAGMSANDVVSSPLYAHLFPCMVKPLSQLLISFYIDERIWLPPSLFKATLSIKRVIVSALEQRRVSTASWWLQLSNVIQEPYVANDIKRYLSYYGLIISSPGCSQPCVLDCDNDDHENLHSRKLKPSAARLHSRSIQNKYGDSLGFRTLISGTPRSGQQHLARCLLHGFKGHIEIQKVNLATISQEGHGDIVRGLSQILLKCLNVGRCVIYMPRIDFWALEKPSLHETKESAEISDMSTAPSAEMHDIVNVSEAWNLFAEQVDSACEASSMIILATCEVQNNDLPLGIRQFFSTNILDHSDSTPSEHSTPRFCLHIDGRFDHDLALNLSTEKLSQDLVQHYIHLAHQKGHMCNSKKTEKASNFVDVVSERQEESRQTSEVLDKTMHSERIVSQEVDVQLHNQPRIPPGKVMKGSAASAIATFGYQILRYPQFAELCWATSKLKEGPNADIDGPWKCWPFNSCVVRPNIPHDKVVGLDTSNLKDKDHLAVVRGLIAVGLLAYRGVYTSVREVSFEVRKVLEILVGHIRAKMQGKKDRYRYFSLLSQVAYLEDMVDSWAYTFKSLQSDNQTPPNNMPSITSNTVAWTVGRIYTDNNVSGSKLIDEQFCVPNVPNINGNEVQEISANKIASCNGESSNVSIENIDPALFTCDAGLVPEAQNFEEAFPLELRLHSGSDLDPVRLASGNGPIRLESVASCKLNGLDTTSNCPDDVANRCNFDSSVTATQSYDGEVSGLKHGSENVLNSNDFGTIGPGNATNHSLRENNHLSAVSEISCVYECCSECLHAVYVIICGILSDCWRSKGRSSTLDDFHDMFASCSGNLLAAVGKIFHSQSDTISDVLVGSEHDHLSEHCACQEFTGGSSKEKACQGNRLESKRILATECSCHSRNKKDTATVNTEGNPLLQPALKFFFRDGVLMPSDLPKDAILHCSFQKLCLCSIIEMVLMSRDTLY